jgi:ribosomal protein S18 acetylase RimI-like enzyme
MPESVTDSVDVAFDWAVVDQDDLLDEIRDLFNASLELDDIIGFPRALPGDQPTDYLEELRADLNAGRKRILLGRSPDRTLIAMAILRRSLMPNCRHVGEISKCVIHPSCRGRGVLTQGVRHLLEYCRIAEIDVLTLDVRKGTRAEGLWRALGFQQFGELPDYARTEAGTHAGVYLWAPVRVLLDAAQRTTRTASAANPA